MMFPQRNTSTAAFVASGVLGLSTVALAVFWPSTYSREKPNETHARLVPRVAAGGGELVAGVEF